MIQHVDRLPAELHLVAFPDAEILVGGEVKVEATRTQDTVPSGIAELRGRLQNLQPGVEPRIGGRMML